MDSKKYYLIIFETRNKAIYLYTQLESIGYKGFQIISVPCSIKLGCNYGIKFNNIRYLEGLTREVEKLNIGKYHIYSIENINGKNKYKEIVER